MSDVQVHCVARETLLSSLAPDEWTVVFAKPFPIEPPHYLTPAIDLRVPILPRRPDLLQMPSMRNVPTVSDAELMTISRYSKTSSYSNFATLS